MSKFFSNLNRTLAYSAAGLLAVVGLGVMIFTQTNAAYKVQAQAEKKAFALSLPGAGISTTVKDYLSASGDSYISLLKTSTVAVGMDSEATAGTDYYDANGVILGRLLVCTFECDLYESMDSASTVTGHLPLYATATIAEVQDGWYKVVSGGVSGYVQESNVATGTDAEALDASTYQTVATVNYDTYLLDSTDLDYGYHICRLYAGNQYVLYVNESSDGWTRISVANAGEGFVPADSISVSTVRIQAQAADAQSAYAELVRNGMIDAQGIEEILAAEQAAAEQAAMEAAAEAEAAAARAASSGVEGGFVVPLNGTFSYGYGYREDGFHGGVDWYCAEGEAIWASAGGTVIAAGWDDGGYGIQVMIDHGNGIITRYAHMCGVAVSVGDVVSQYDVIGYAGETGQAEGVHCHFEVYLDGSRIDPFEVLY